ncbi:ribosomal protein S7 [Exidia glandulosa HHB12029]|uniref:Ribosomal protein S7 n=1 Tax=Exidia glandulosa HHB12029 TaxID=1314781 RepID=A0A165NLL0_EXIGL|nr:ribosomal protein S7 [Exidia glandulosa HHB12029]
MSMLGRIAGKRALTSMRAASLPLPSIRPALLSQRRTAVSFAAVKTGTQATQLLKADIPPLEDPLLHYMAGLIMKHGRRHKASKTLSLMLMHIHALSGSQPMEILREAIIRAAPSVKVMSLKKGMKVTLHPVPLSEKARTRQAILWILRAQMYRAGPTLSERLAKEVVGLVQGSSQVLAWKEQDHGQAMVNRAIVRVPLQR